jgi:CBS domain-containing protein
MTDIDDTLSAWVVQSMGADQLPASLQESLIDSLSLQDMNAGASVAEGAQFFEHLYWLTSGEVDLLNPQGQVVLVLRAPATFGLALGSALDVHAARARTDGRLVRMDAQSVAVWRQRSDHLAYFLPAPAPSDTPPDREAARKPPGQPSLHLTTAPVASLIRRRPVTLSPLATIREAAQVMREERVSSVLIVQEELLFGLITDRDLRNRVIASDVSSDRPVLDIATLAPLTIPSSHPAFEALLLMARHNIHHVPVVDGSRIVGMITATDLTEQHSTSPVYLAGEIYKEATTEGLQRAAGKVRRLQQSLAASEASAYSTGHIITTITDAITTRLIQLGEAQLGPPPVEFVWVAAGSQARNEQTARSDQDNCMVLDDAYDEALHGEYFKALSRFVCDGLDACGYVHCPGEMMAMNDQWRLPRHRWAEHFTRWTGQPDPKSLMLTCVFFDLRAIYGKVSLLEHLRHEVLQRTRGNSIFLAHMVGNALLHQPPLGMFKGLATIRSGEHKGTIDLKHTGVVPIVDLARVYALAGGDSAVNTHDRLSHAAAGGAISEQSARDLRDALEFLASLRIRHQSRQIDEEQVPDNFLRPEEISNFERTQLKDAFQVVASLQNVLGQRYRM